jgi:hypothetical protein
VNFVAQSFSWPFQGRWRSAWGPGLLATLLLPVAFIPLLGFAIASTRAASIDPSGGPPRWRASVRLLSDGFWTALAIVLLTAPFALLLMPFANLLSDAHLWHVSDHLLSEVYAYLGASFALALPWGLLLLLVMPHAVAQFASSGRPADLFDFRAAVRGVRRDFTTWNLAAAAIVTAWAAALACIGLLCVGIVPGIFYAILVSAHASAALHDTGANPPAR